MKKVLAIVLCILMILPSLSVGAEEIQKFYEVNIDSGSGVVTEKAIIDNGEIYIPATSFSKYTRFSFNPENNLFLIDGQEFSKAIKSVHIDRQNKKIRVSNTYLIGLQGYYERDNILYLPMTQMLPILNADIYEVKENVIYISNNQLSLAEVLYNFDIQNYWFNISEEFGNSTLALWWFMVPNYILDTITGCRFDRLDVTYSGNYNDYKNIFSEFLADDNLYLKALAQEPSKLNSTVELFGATNSLAKKLKSVFGWVEAAGKSNIDSNTGGALFDSLKAYYDSGELKTNDLKGLSDAWIKGDISFADYIELFTYIHTYVNQVEDHKQMLAAVYEVDKKSNSKSEDFKAAKQVYNLYGENVETAIVKEIAQMFSEEVLSELLSPISVYTATSKVAGIALKSVMPYDYGDIANLPTYSNIVLTASSKVNRYSFKTDKETENKRLSLLLTLIASKRCFEIMSDSFKGYGKDNSYYENKIAKLEQMIMALYIVEENTEFDSFEHFEEYAKNNKARIKEAISSPKEHTETNISSQQQSSSQQSSSSQQNSNPSTSNSTSSEETNEQQTTNITLTEAKEIAENLISKYHQFSFLGTCCDVEYSDLDMSRFLTQTQKNNYYYYQYKITCCHSIENVKQHILKHIDKSLIYEFNSENFFNDDNGNLYVFLTLFGIAGYGDISISEFSANKIVAKAAYEDIDGPTGTYDVFVIEKKGNNFIITGIKR